MNRKNRISYNRDYDDYHDKRKATSRRRSRSPRRDPDRGSRRDRSRSPHYKELEIQLEIPKRSEPSDLWDNGNFIMPPPPPTFNDNPPYTYSGIYDDFPSIPPAPQPPDICWNQTIPPAAPASTSQNYEDKLKKEAAIESEMRHQRAALSKQREDYVKKSANLKKELDTLKDQRNELRGDNKRSPSPETKRFLKENTKLQLEIQNKLKTIDNVVDMLNGIIGGDMGSRSPSKRDSSVEKPSKRKSRSPTRFNYVYYDPEMHWCRLCNEFPATAKDYLNHLHSQGHYKNAITHTEAPWHSLPGLNEGFPSHPSAPNKRTPIKGLQFLVPSTAWYCKLCDQFIGDLHCASAHLKSMTHSKNFANFVEQNPHWETDWMSDRQKAFEKKTENATYTPHTYTFNKDGFHTKSKKSVSPKKEEKKKRDKKKVKKKRKSSSSRDSSSESYESRRATKKKNASNEKSKVMKEWMSIHVDKLTDSDKMLLDTLKKRIKGNRNSDVNEDEKTSTSTRDSTNSKDDKSPNKKDKKPDVKKMPFIGKMPVFKAMIKKTDDIKKEDTKKKDDDDREVRKKDIDEDVQKKVAIFREKLTKAQIDHQHVDLGPPGVSLAAEPIPLRLLGAQQLVLAPAQNIPSTNSMNLQKDFQDALNIIFPNKQSDINPMYSAIPNLPIQMQPPYPPLNSQIRMNYNIPHPGVFPNQPLRTVYEHGGSLGNASPNKNVDLADLALLGIDATDVGSGI